MPAQPATATPARRTRASNATAHPGAILLQARKPRRTTEEVAAAREEKAAKAAAQAAAAEAGAKRVAGIELEMEVKQTSVLTRKVKGVRPRPTPYKGKKAAKDSPDVAATYGGGDDEVGTNQAPGILTQKADVLMDLDNDAIDQDPCRKIGSTVKKKVTKASMKDAVNHARKQIKRTTADGGDKAARVDKEGNVFDVKQPELALANKVKSWASGVNIPMMDTSHATHTSASPPPSTIFSRLTGSSMTTHSAIPADVPKGPPQHIDAPEDVLAGDFADDEDEDDELERLAAYGITAKEGRSAAAMAVTLTVDDSDDELEIPAEFRAPFTQLSPLHPSGAASSSSVLKRKASEVLDLISGSEIDDFSDDAGESTLLADANTLKLTAPLVNDTMDIDLPDEMDQQHEAELEKPKVKLEKPPRTTTSTSVMTTDVKPSATKKVKVESSSTSVNAAPAPKEQQSVNVDTPHDKLKPRAQYRGTDLPEQVQADNRWAKKFLPTMILWAGSQECLWSIPDATLLTHVQIVFQAIYPDVNLTIVLNGAVFSLYPLHTQTIQRLSEWRSSFGSTAIVLIYDFLMSNSDCDPEVLAGLLLKNYAFIFEDMDKRDPDSAFHSVFILQLLGKAHLNVINGHANIPALKTKDLASKGMAGVIVFCATALERAVTLISEGDIKVEDILASATSRGKVIIKLPKVLNKITGKETSGPYMFSRDLWGKANTGYMKSIKKKSKNFVETIVEMARSALNESTAADAAISHSSDDDRAFLCSLPASMQASVSGLQIKDYVFKEDCKSCGNHWLYYMLKAQIECLTQSLQEIEQPLLRYHQERERAMKVATSECFRRLGTKLQALPAELEPINRFLLHKQSYELGMHIDHPSSITVGKKGDAAVQKSAAEHQVWFSLLDANFRIYKDSSTESRGLGIDATVSELKGKIKTVERDALHPDERLKPVAEATTKTFCCSPSPIIAGPAVVLKNGSPGAFTAADG
ncbi:hypothetical protein F4604DRAFT_1677553 [Suillus subluteus]|nr:hypothetical protein F4604DRAFT_1677553 [Suillus subluteus]